MMLYSCTHMTTVGVKGLTERCNTYHATNMSASISTQVNSANTIQYIIHFTWSNTTHAQQHLHTDSTTLYADLRVITLVE